MYSYTEHLQISLLQVYIYYALVLFSALYMFRKYGVNKITILVFLIFWEGLFGVLHKLDILSLQYYRIIVVIYLFYLFRRDIFLNKSKKDFLVNLCFASFTVVFIISNLNHLSSPLTVLSQFFFQYSVIYFLYHGLKNRMKNLKFQQYLVSLILTVVFIQVFLSIGKFFVMGVREAIVGSLSAKGAGAAVTLPILGFIFYALHKRMNLTTKEWLIALSLFMIAFLSNKRSPVFLFPLYIFLMSVYVTKTFNPKKFLKYIPIVLLVFYIGLRSNHSFNPEGTTWGSFDVQYAIDYALQYNFGVREVSDISAETSTSGRGAAFLQLFNKDIIDSKDTRELLFGDGVSSYVLDEYYQDERKAQFGLVGVTGFSMELFFTLGYMGLFFYLLFYYAVLNNLRVKRLKVIILFFVLWETFFYNGVMVGSNAMVFLLIVIIMYANNIKAYNSYNIFNK